MWTRLELWWAAKRTRAGRSDEALAAATEEVTKAIAQTVANRAMGRPSLSSGDPGESAVNQLAYDRETVDRYRETIHPEVATLRDEYVARGLWSPELEARWGSPSTVADLRALVIALHELAGTL